MKMRLTHRSFLACLVVLFLSTPVLSNAAMKNGTIIQVSGSPALYYAINGYAAHIPSPRVYNCMQLNTHKRQTITPQQLNSMPKTAFLVKGSNNNIYRIDGEFRRHVPNMQVYRRLGFNEREIIHVSDSVISCIPKGPDLR